MRGSRLLLAAAALCCAGTPSLAAEGSSVAGPIGGTDMRSAQLPPPPGLYGGTIQLYAEAHKFFDGEGRVALRALDLARKRVGPFLLYVPDVQVFGGSIGVAGIVPAGTECGRLFATTPERCITGVGDPYVEVAWSRFFGTLRPSQYPGAYPIADGLTIAAGFGAVIPSGRYSARDGNNIWDFAPSAALTFMTRPILAEGIEISAKLYWNNYRGWSCGSELPKALIRHTCSCLRERLTLTFEDGIAVRGHDPECVLGRRKPSVIRPTAFTHVGPR